MEIAHGIVDVPAAGTRVRLTTSTTPCKWLRFRNVEGNTGETYVGGASVASTTGWTLWAGVDSVDSTLTLDPGAYGGTLDLKDFYVDAATNGDDVEYFAIVARSS